MIDIQKKKTHSRCPACNATSSGGGWFTARSIAKSNCELCNNTKMVPIEVAYRYIRAIENGTTGKASDITARGFTLGDYGSGRRSISGSS